VNRLQAFLNSRHHGRREVVHALLCALLAGRHAYLVGPPGTDKTSLLKDLADSIRGAVFEQVGLHGQVDLARLIGPFDIARWEHGDGAWKRTPGYLPGAHIALLDEVDAAPGSVTDMLTRFLAERTWKNGADTEVVPLITAVGAGNDIPVRDRLWDRFLVRVRVEYLTDPTDVAALLAAPGDGAANATLTLTTLKRHQTAAMALPLPPAVAAAMVGLRFRLHAQGILVSDRRFAESAGLVRAAAYLRGAGGVGLVDLGILRHAWWLRPDQADAVSALVDEVAAGNADAIAGIAVRLAAITSRVEAAGRWGTAGRDLVDGDIEVDLDPIEGDLGDLAAAGVDVMEAREHLEGLRGLVAAPGARAG
jgi:MoxR-like ATPase